jgi:inner membrane protein
VAGSAMEAPVGWRLLMMAAGAFGGLLPDIDTPASTLGSKISKRFHRLTPGHRGPTHSLLWLPFIYFLFYGVELLGTRLEWWDAPDKHWVPVAIVAGVVTHLLGDGITEQGVPLLWPWKFKFRLPEKLRFRAGDDTERVVLVAFLALAGGYIFAPTFDFLIDKVLTAPVVHAFGRDFNTEPIMVFVVSALVCWAILWWYMLRKEKRRSGRNKSRSTSRNSKRSRK